MDKKRWGKQQTSVIDCRLDSIIELPPDRLILLQSAFEDFFISAYICTVLQHHMKSKILQLIISILQRMSENGKVTRIIINNITQTYNPLNWT